MSAERVKWDQRYSAPGWLMGRSPKAVLRSWSGDLPSSGRALDLACGEGQTAVFLARRGLRVDGVDVSRVGLTKARALADSAGADISSRIRLTDHDLGAGPPTSLSGPYALVTCLHYRQVGLIARIGSWLGPEGVLLVERPSVLALELGLEAPSARFLAERGELIEEAHAAGCRVLRHEEGIFEGRAVARLLAVRTGPSQ